MAFIPTILAVLAIASAQYTKTTTGNEFYKCIQKCKELCWNSDNPGTVCDDQCSVKFCYGDPQETISKLQIFLQQEGIIESQPEEQGEALEEGVPTTLPAQEETQSEEETQSIEEATEEESAATEEESATTEEESTTTEEESTHDEEPLPAVDPIVIEEEVPEEASEESESKEDYGKYATEHPSHPYHEFCKSNKDTPKPNTQVKKTQSGWGLAIIQYSLIAAVLLIIGKLYYSYRRQTKKVTYSFEEGESQVPYSKIATQKV
ncbi:unnamed protein product [Blepharisma stoltei]|uniref:Uncharacterized protein n=1 Tax=Blepharisma stoltei TaxID=1481888 RepID=A0AAU9J667_9CILI|nr:unnamed protein product [Blepharisma stoltei]